MSAPQFTPGPWRIDPCLRQQIEIERRIKAVSLAFPNDTVATVEAFQGTGARDANASLIAAAPELYDALHDLVNCIDRADETAACIKAEAVLAKALGGA